VVQGAGVEARTCKMASVHSSSLACIAHLFHADSIRKAPPWTVELPALQRFTSADVTASQVI
jgi:hypothetical protein